MADSTPAYLDALRMLARRELSAARVRARLADRAFPPDAIDAAVARLLDRGALDDRRVARAHARTAATVKGRGRLRVLRELHEMGIEGAVAAEAVGEVFGELDERALVAKALHKKLHGRTTIDGPQEYARVYQFLMRQGFTSAAVVAALQRLRGGRRSIDLDQE